MADVTVKRIEDFEAIFGGGMRRARAGLGVTSFGMQIEELAPNMDQYPEHDHTHDGMEEVYVVMKGSATLRAGGRDYELEPGVLARVGPGEKRKIVAGEDGALILALGGVPGQVYEPPEFTKEGEPDPMAGQLPKV
jgi:mannose-6-phosphate isomerase-like protein (cupin superfamily)